MKIKKNGTVINTLDDWRRLAGPKDPEKQWKADRSAMESARAWLASPGAFPPEIASLLTSHPDFGLLTVDEIEPEAELRFDKWHGPRNADIAMLSMDEHGAVAVTVEAKADESFDELVSDALSGALERRIVNSRSRGVDRILDLAAALLPPIAKGNTKVGALRYQLLTATAGTLALARDGNATRAVLVVHEIQSTATSLRALQRNASDLDAFVRRVSGGTVNALKAGQLEGPFHVTGAPLFDNAAALYIGKAVRVLGQPGP